MHNGTYKLSVVTKYIAFLARYVNIVGFQLENDYDIGIRPPSLIMVFFFTDVISQINFLKVYANLQKLSLLGISDVGINFEILRQFPVLYWLTIWWFLMESTNSRCVEWM